MLAASTACCTSIPNSTTFKKNCSRFWSCVSPPCTANARNGLPSFIARLGVNVTRGRLPGTITLKGLSALSTTNCCARWLTPMPVWPAITAGIQPPDGVTETTQPDVSAASIDVVPRRNASSKAASAAASVPPSDVVTGRGDQRWSSGKYGLVPPWNGYGSPGLISGSLRLGLISLARSRAYSLDSSPRIGSYGGNAGSP